MNKLKVYRHEYLEYDYTREEIPEQSQFFMHIHTEMEVYYLIEGRVEYHVENSVYLPQPGDVMIMRSGEAHTSLADRSGPYERFNLRFAPELLAGTPHSKLLLPFLERPLGVFNHYKAGQIPSEYIRACFGRMFAKEIPRSQERSIHYLLPILQELYDVWVTRENKPEDPPASMPAQIISYINHHLLQLQSPQQISDTFYLSQSQLYRIFREYTGTSIWDYVRTKRLFAARDRLFSGTAPHEAAAICGFSEYSTFFRAYKKQFGHSPKEDFGAGKSSASI